MSRQVRQFIISEIRDRLGVITLNRVSQFNALFEPMIDEALLELTYWSKQSSKLSCVAIKGAHDEEKKKNLFCAGGDVKCIVRAYRERNLSAIDDQCQAEYSLVHRLSTFPVPTVALVDGICMGTGGGILAHSQYGVVTERAIFSMPETAIGIAPDAGLAVTFNGMRSNLGVFMGLSGHRLKGSCIQKAGVANYFVRSTELPKLEQSLASLDSSAKVEEVLKDFHEKSKQFQNEFSLQAQIGEIEECFGKNSVEECLEALPDNEWGISVRKTLSQMSPTALKVTFKHINNSYKSLLSCLQMDATLAHRMLRSHDFIEGVSALLIDKNRKPVWRPDNLEDVKDANIDDLFELPDEEDLFIPLHQR